jgi:CheY-specific phosphatase CheX
MSVAQSAQGTGFPLVIADAVTAAVETTFTAICGEKPLPVRDSPEEPHDASIVGIISFVGDLAWSLAWGFTQDSAAAIAQKFTGFEIPFESPDMGDVVAELVNVLAGDVVHKLDRRRIKAQMSLPTVARGESLELMPDRGHSLFRLHYTSTHGQIWFRLVTAQTDQGLAGMMET